MKKAFEICSQLRSDARGDIAYDLARAHAAAGSTTDAIKYLDEAIASDPGYRDAARNDKQLAALAGDKRFQALMRL